MIALVLFLTFGLFFGYFATLNTSLVSIHFGATAIRNIPIYQLVLASFGAGILFTALFYFFKSIPGKFFLGRKQKELSDARKENVDLTKHIHELELEITKLQAKNGESETDEESI
jgi:hypothetical protein